MDYVISGDAAKRRRSHSTCQLHVFQREQQQQQQLTTTTNKKAHMRVPTTAHGRAASQQGKKWKPPTALRRPCSPPSAVSPFALNSMYS